MGKRHAPELSPEPETNTVEVEVIGRARASGPCSLEMVEGPGAPRLFRLYREEIVVGRSSASDISLGALGLSRTHAVLKRERELYKVKDLESRNGVFLNGVKVHSAVLHEGDTLQLGEVVFVFHEGQS